MSQNEVLKAEYRDHSWKPAQMRSEGWVPGVVYGKGFEGLNIKVPKLELEKFFHHSGKVFEVEVQGHGKHLVALDQVQRGHFGTDYIHFSFHKIIAGQKTTVTLPIHFVGDMAAASQGGIAYPAMHEVEVTGLPKDLPEFVEIDITNLAMDTHWALKDITAPKGCEWGHNVDESVVACHTPKVVAEVVEESTAVVEPTVEDMTPVEDKEAA